ncbi:MAG: DUF2232 domain-containing protein [Nitrospiraceae bacterium]|nr:DUF2232 domain-containing protein [Nitrospiraceae bacterium]
MRPYLLTAGALFLGCVLAALLGLYLIGLALFPVPVAFYMARGHTREAKGLVACAALAGVCVAWVPMTGLGVWQAALSGAVVASVGLPLGYGILHRWTYGWTVTAMAVIAGALVIGGAVVTWPQWVAHWDAQYDLLLTQQLKLQEEAGDSAERIRVNTEILRAVKEAWPKIGLGLTMFALLVVTCAGLSFAAGWMRRRFEIEGLRGSFKTMRTSEWLIWVVIAVALVWYVDRKWFDSSWSVVTMNAAIGLAAIYWLNGFSVLLYALSNLRPPFFVYLAIVVMLVMFRLHPVLCCVGLFDTWSDFRRIVDGVIEKRRQAAETNSNDE